MVFDHVMDATDHVIDAINYTTVSWQNNFSLFVVAN